MNSDDTRASVERLSLGELELLVIDLPLEAKPGSESLSPTESEVAHLAVAGLSNKEIAARRSTSVKTVANQLRAIYRKLEINSRFELAAKMPQG